MKITDVLFSTSGRIGRLTFALYYIPFIILNLLIYVGIGIATNGNGLGLLMFFWSLIVIFPFVAVTSKRLHDVNMSGWWIVFLLIPLANIIALIPLLIILFGIKGGEAPNRFGSATDNRIVCPTCNSNVSLSQAEILEEICPKCQKSVRVPGAPKIEAHVLEDASKS